MKKTVTVFGLIAGAIVSLMLGFSIMLMKHQPVSDTFGMIVGFGSMLLAFSFIFIAVKSYRDKELGGTISFGKAFMTGLWIAVIASVCYTITWVIIYKNFYPEFMNEMSSRQIAKLQESGKSAAAMAAELKKIENMKAMYATWPGLIGFTLMEILPLGILVSLVSAFKFRRKPQHADLAKQAA